MSNEPVTKLSGVSIPVSREMLDDAPIDLWNATFVPRSPLERARDAVAEAEGELEAAEDALHWAREELAKQEATPGSDVRGEPYTMNEAMLRALDSAERDVR